MIDSDAAFDELEREIRKALVGDQKNAGFYTTIRNSPNWDTFVRIRGIIEGYEAVHVAMQRIRRRMNGDPVEQHEERVVN